VESGIRSSQDLPARMIIERFAVPVTDAAAGSFNYGNERQKIIGGHVRLHHNVSVSGCKETISVTICTEISIPRCSGQMVKLLSFAVGKHVDAGGKYGRFG